MMSDEANTSKNLADDPEAARRAVDRAEAEYYYQLALRKERELGRAAGREEGRVEGRAEMVLKMITLRFGPPSTEIEERVRVASLEELDRLIEKVLFSPTLEAFLRE